MSKFIVILILSIFLISCGDKKEFTSNDTPKGHIEDEPSQTEIENEVFYLVGKISYESYKYNTSFFLDRDGVYKNLSVSSVRINKREGIKSGEQMMNLHLTGIADKYNVAGFGGTSYAGRINFSIDKDFKFSKSGGKWIGYIYDDIRDSKTLRLKKDFLR